jgi:hypothetical protein
VTRVPAVAVVLAVAAFAAGIATAASTDTTATTPTDTTAPSTVTVTTERTATVQTTVQQTVQQTVTTAPATTAPATTSSSSGSSFPTWAIVLIVVGGIGLIVAVAFLLGRGKRSEDSSLDGRRRILDAAVASSVASGWSVESSGPTEAVIRHNGDRAMLTVDEHGQINRRRLESDERPPDPEVG